MKKAWKTDLVVCSQKEPRFFSFVFQSKEDEERIIKTGPWSFASNLLVLKQCELEIQEHCYDFSHCTFWVQIGGIPPGWFREEVFVDLAERVGRVLEIQVDSKGNGPYKVGKARVETRNKYRC